MNKLSLPNAEWISLAKGAGIAAVGAILTYASQHITATDFGSYGPAVVVLLSVLVNYFRKVVVTPAA